MKILEFGNIESNTILIQPVDDHDLAVMDNEVSVLKKMAGDNSYQRNVVTPPLVVYNHCKSRQGFYHEICYAVYQVEKCASP